MHPGRIIYLLTAWYIGMCYGFVLLSSAAGPADTSALFQPGDRLLYELHSTILLNEHHQETSKQPKNVGYYIGADLLVDSVWGGSGGGSGSKKRILRIELISPKLHIRSRKAPSPDGFTEHKSKLDDFENKEFYIVWSGGKIERLYLSRNEEVSLANLKRGIASLFQVGVSPEEIEETDSSGKCTTTFTTTSSTTFRKTKTNCTSPDLPRLVKNNIFLGTTLNSQRTTDYEITDLEYLQTISHKEKHTSHLSSYEDVGSSIEVDHILRFKSSEKTEILENSFEVVLNGIINRDYLESTLLTEKEDHSSSEVKTFSAAVNDARNYLKSEELGSANSAKAFIRLVSAARTAQRDDIAKTLGSKKNKYILPQLYDVLGCVQTEESHAGVMKKLHLEKEEYSELSERYLWALSIHDYPNPDILEDLLKRYRKSISIPEKVKETLILTLGSMAFRLREGASPKTRHTNRIIEDVEEIILNGLDYSKNEERFIFLRALRNLKSEKTIPVLLKVIQKGTPKEGSLAWRVLSSLRSSTLDDNVLKTAKKSFYQIDRKYDTSSRTIAADILLESTLTTDYDLEEIVNYLKSNDSAFEIKQYVLQRLQMLAERDPGFSERVRSVIRKDKYVNNYSTLNPGGFSISLERNFLANPSVNGSLTTVQEVLNKVVKRGSINVVLDKNGTYQEFYSIGLFAGGLSSFVSSGTDEEEEEEPMTAGMDLTIFGTQIRPFVFFSGQSELMGHVWSGTASDRTTAYQALVLLQDDLQFIRLGSGFIAEFDIKGAASLDLAGKVELSLWNRYAQAVVEKSSGVAVIGSTRIETSFVRSQVMYTTSVEPKLYFEIDLDFSANMRFCLRLTQTNNLFKHNIFKSERIPGSKHKLRIAKYKKYNIPGITYSLNKKNNDMCNAIFST